MRRVTGLGLRREARVEAQIAERACWPPHHVVPEDTPVAGDATTAPACPRAMCGRESERKRGAQPHNGWGWGRGRPFLKPPLESP